MESIAAPEETGKNQATSSLQIDSVASADSHESNLDLAIVGNGTISALIDSKGSITWLCMPSLDADPVFCRLLRKRKDVGFWDVAIENYSHSEQEYIKNTPILKTTLYDGHGNSVEIVDFAPRYLSEGGKIHRPNTFVRILTPTGRPRVSIRLRPMFGVAWGVPEKSRGSNHIRYLMGSGVLRLTTNAPISYVFQETFFEIDEPVYCAFTSDESMTFSVDQFAKQGLRKTRAQWEHWISKLSIPPEWQPQLLRAAIHMKLACYEDTGAIVSAVTTSIPTSPHDGHRTVVDARLCKVAELPFLVRTAHEVNMTQTMTRLMSWLSSLVESFNRDVLPTFKGKTWIQPMYGLATESVLQEAKVHRLAGYRDIGPVAIGNNGYKGKAVDTFGSVILALTPRFVDATLIAVQGDRSFFEECIEPLGELLIRVVDSPDMGSTLGLGELPRGRRAVCLLPTVTSWAALNRLSQLAEVLRLRNRVAYWKERADAVKEFVESTFWDDKRGYFVSVAPKKNEEEGEEADGEGRTVTSPPSNRANMEVHASALLLPEFGFIAYDDPRYLATMREVERRLLRNGVFLHSGAKGEKFCHSVCSFWYVDALHNVGRKEEARKVYEEMLKLAGKWGALSETIDPDTKEHWGNFPHTLAVAHMLKSGKLLSKRWDQL